VKEFVAQAAAGKISIVEHTQKILEEAKKQNSRYNCFVVISEKEALQQARELEKLQKAGKAKGKLFGVPVSVKDNICVKGIESRAGSAILNGYKPLFDATAIARIKAEGGIIIGKTSQDEFGFGTFSTNTGVGFAVPKNPLDEQRACGGSSGGSAAFTALTGFTHVSLAESTGGSIACPASFCGVVGLTPTYGLVSRYGLIDYANSLDKIGAMGKTVEDAAMLLDVVVGHDERDSTSLQQKTQAFSAENSVKGLRVGIIKDFFGKGIDSTIASACKSAIEKLKKNGAIVQEISLPLNAEFAVATYYLIATTEASTNLAKFSGMRYGAHEKLDGVFDEYFSVVRSKWFGKEAKRRIILGTFARMSGYRDAYYLRAAKARSLLIEEFKNAFKRFDVLINPTMPVIAPKFSDIEKMAPLQQYAMDLCTVPANLAGLPHISVNAGFDGKMPIGLMIVANHLEEKKLIQIARALEEPK
jgi:aspartyl-tRNA(Asn)/glutamyl-tRNA(Gln) amidotransferase subunit A